MKRPQSGKAAPTTKNKARDVIRKASIPSSVKKLMRLVERLQKGIKERDAELAERPTKDDYDCIERHAAYVQEKIQKRDARIVRLLAKTKNFNRVKKRMQQLEFEVFEYKSIMDEHQESWKTQLNSLVNPTDNFGLFKKRYQRYESTSEKLSKAADAVIGNFDFDCDTTEDLMDTLNGGTSVINDAKYLVERYKCDLWDAERDFNDKIEKLNRFVKGLQQELEVFYANIDNPETFRSEFLKKIKTRRATVKRLTDELKYGEGNVPDDAEEVEDFAEMTRADIIGETYPDEEAEDSDGEADDSENEAEDSDDEVEDSDDDDE